MEFRLGDQVVAQIKGKKVRGEYLDGDKKKSYILTQNGDELEVRTKKLKLAF